MTQLKNYVEGKTFRNENFTQTGFIKGEYENCIFSSCQLAGVDLSGCIFSDCAFEQSDLTNARIATTAFRDVRFTHCKLMGLRFDECSSTIISFTFKECILSLASFFRLKLKNTIFDNCKLLETDFAEADLTGAVFDQCDLGHATFENTILENADLRTATNFSINPNTNRIRRARFSTDNIAGLLDIYDIRIE